MAPGPDRTGTVVGKPVDDARSLPEGTSAADGSPSHSWGLDPLFWTYIRALACILSPPHLQYLEGFDFGPFLLGPGERPVCKAMLVGTVVAVRQLKRQGRGSRGRRKRGSRRKGGS
ncbi:hypothetical protein Naga_101590g2 [Nannochloropsis gaditana]|uniref:Uncharacterized protein n=1 Tax=Nannochloropsis gaditana TaxID=72520 RepID=W7TXU6_9STRA|nr:hypothetical protein Naga_101590g2 [Nannochloropsis gaditana]